MLRQRCSRGSSWPGLEWRWSAERRYPPPVHSAPSLERPNWRPTRLQQSIPGLQYLYSRYPFVGPKPDLEEDTRTRRFRTCLTLLQMVGQTAFFFKIFV
jgi:hypothetical protein